MRGLISFYRKRIFRITEFLVLFVIVPTLLFTKVIDISFFPILLLGGVIFLIQLIRDPSFRRKRLWNWGKARKSIGRIFLYFVPVALLMTVVVYFWEPDHLFYLPRKHPWLWLGLLVSYPLFSVIPQNIAFRAFFVHRYRKLFQSNSTIILASATMFAFGHIIFHNWLAVILTFIGGILFTKRYIDTKSLVASIIEHSLYGVWLFTCGLGMFFTQQGM
jgi:uncharacterized protein